ncbi:MAG: GTP 3',8-cyclase MoaA [Methanosarcinales archaeon]|nr:GTP 3',8-cyclase MoaA [ANME-2 cluster archaeon]MDF1532032.1 GTP 3',8-cyclase MoaA [ANME-2 cluster archaeon]MDW7776052.1 GTP 3',8-cyclase MoaA [Methanosarcinales archaeon]
MEPDALIDSFGRRITSLRISITSKCNLNCYYCHNEGQSRDGSQMSPEHIVNIIRTASKLGVKRVKFSGGEPLMRQDFEDILVNIPKFRNVSATTNGVLLSKRAVSLKSAGLDRVNISLDTLQPETYANICRCNKDIHHMVLDGIQSAVHAGLTPVKLNMVMLKGINETELDDMISFVRLFDGDVILQIIEPMDFGNYGGRVNMDAIEKNLGSRASEVVEREMHRRKKYLLDGAEVEVVRPIDNSRFCAHCSRLRVTADGKLKPCLLVDDNLVDVSRAGIHELEPLFHKAVNLREPFYKG